MMTTNEERREIAAKLRELATRNRGVFRAMWMEETLAEAQEILGTRGIPSVAHVLGRYADLIEPEPERTCRAEERYNDDDSSPWPYYVCSACGEILRYDEFVGDDGEYGFELLPYCSKCGAKVVSE